MNGFKLLLIFLLSMLFLVSCSSFLDEAQKGMVYGDVFIKAVADSSEVRYAPVFYVYGNQPMVAATVVFDETPNEKKELDSLDFGYTFAHFPSELDYTQEKPQKGNYRFEGVFDGQLKSQSFDYLSDKVIEPSVLTKASIDRGNQSISLEWNCDVNAEKHKVAIFASNGEVIYESSLLMGSQKSLVIEKTSSGWFSASRPGKEDPISIEVFSYLFEPISSSFDIQCVTVSKRVSLVW